MEMRRHLGWEGLSLLLVAGCGIDLVPIGLQAPVTARVGEDITDSVSAGVYNIGTNPVTAEDCTGVIWLYFLLSEDEEIGLDDFHVTIVDFLDFPLGPRQAKAVLFDDEDEKCEILSGAPQGNVYFGVFVDAHGYCAELNEQNNTAALPIEILPAP
jgi:hypothetical protein